MSTADFESHQTWSKLSFDVWAMIDRSTIDKDAKLFWISLQQPLKQSGRPGYLERDGKPMDPEIIAKILGKSEKKVRNWLADLLLVGALKKDEFGTLFEPFMAKHERERLKDRERKAGRNSSGIPEEIQRNANGQREEPDAEPEPKPKPQKEKDSAVVAAKEDQRFLGHDAIVDSIISSTSSLSQDEFLEFLKEEKRFEGINIKVEFDKQFHYRHSKKLGPGSRHSFIRWLLRYETPIKTQSEQWAEKNGIPDGDVF